MTRALFPAALSVLIALAACHATPDTNVAPTKPSTPVASVAPPAGASWATSVTETTDGGYLRGNPNAAVKLVEYGALSCPHCAHFVQESHDELNAMISSGKLSYELRPYLVHPQLDLPATLLAACNGKDTFFALAEQFFTHQDEWIGPEKFKLLTPDVQKAWATMTPNQLAADVAAHLDLITFVSQRGVSAERAKACLADKSAVDKLNHMMSVADTSFHVSGTPTFVINGGVAADVNDWTALKPKLKAAIGG